MHASSPHPPARENAVFDRILAAILWPAIGLCAVMSIQLCFNSASIMASRFHAGLEGDRVAGTTADHAIRLFRGQPIYIEPDDTFVPYLYTPGYYAVAAVAMHLWSEGLTACRAASLILLILSIAAFVIMNRVVTRAWWPSLLVLPMICCGYSVCGYHYDTIRVDAAASAALAVTFTIAVFARRASGGIAMGLGLALAFWCKQSTAIAAAIFLLALLPLRPRVSLAAGGTYLLFVAITVFIASASTAGWFWTYVIELPRSHSLRADLAWQQLSRDWMRPILVIGLLLLIAAALIGRPGSRRIALRTLAAAALAVTGYTVASAANPGSTLKILMPLCVFIGGVLPVVFWHFIRSVRSRRGQRIAGILVTLCSLILIWLNPAMANHAAPDPAATRAWNTLLERVREHAVRGPVWLCEWGYVTTSMPGQSMRPGMMPLDDYLGGRFGPPTGRSIPPLLAASITKKKFAAVFFSTHRNDSPVFRLLQQHYKPLDSSLNTTLRRGRLTLDMSIYVPRR